MKKVLVAEDLSCYGRCSLAVALPILAAADAEVVILPTAVFSTHTGISREAKEKDFSEEMSVFLEHWESLKIGFDALLIGYAAGRNQLRILKDFIRRKSELPVITDPAMAEGGKLYGRFSEDYAEEMKELCKLSDYLTPNVTEAFLLAGLPYHEGPYERAEMRELLKRISETFEAAVVITGVPLSDGLYVFGKEGEELFDTKTTYVNRNLSGTGDAFAAAFTGRLLQGYSMKEAAADAGRLASEAVAESLRRGMDRLYFEYMMKEMINGRG